MFSDQNNCGRIKIDNLLEPAALVVFSSYHQTVASMKDCGVNSTENFTPNFEIILVQEVFIFNTLGLSDTNMCQQNMPLLVQIMVCGLFGLSHYLRKWQLIVNSTTWEDVHAQLPKKLSKIKDEILNWTVRHHDEWAFSPLEALDELAHLFHKHRYMIAYTHKHAS